MSLRAIFFDAFGTLILWEREEPHLQLSRRLARLGIEVAPEKVAAILEGWESHLAERVREDPDFATLAMERNRPFWQYFYGYILGQAGIEGNHSAYIKGIYEGFFDERLYPDPEALTLLPQLRSRGFILGMISNAPRNIDDLCRGWGLNLDLVITSAEVGVEKPHPAIFLAALRKAGVKPQEAIYVGDDYNNDVQGAEKAGFKAILLDREGSQKELGCTRINRLIEIADLI